MEILKCSFFFFKKFNDGSFIAFFKKNPCNYVIMGLLSINRMSNLKSQNKISNFFFVNQTCSIQMYPMDLNPQHNQIHVFCNKLSMVLIETLHSINAYVNEYSN